ncbi:MAG: hypothetical protein HFJ43_00235 [Clostridia bacterium]|nr:hypothetical protein [Clostridia bacterium]
MSLGTVAYNNKIYNLDYMTADEVQNLLETIEKDKLKVKREIKKAIN